MKSNLEKKLGGQRASVESLVKATHDDVIEVMCSFSGMECVADVKLAQGGWVRYLLIEGGVGENDDSLRRIG